ncbi:MAG: hypothetical protein L0Z54_01025 [Thermoplasmata archaeon]|nr:hypothetical protein [Thermoplasmata archaeon]
MPKTLGRCKLCGVSKLLNYAGLCKRCNREPASADIKLAALTEVAHQREELKAAKLRQMRLDAAAAAAAAKAAAAVAEELGEEAPAEPEAEEEAPEKEEEE